MIKGGKKYKITFYSRYFKSDVRTMYYYAESKKFIRDNWHAITCTDEFVIKKIEEVESYIPPMN